jgi:hypothetical protein
MTLIHCTVHRMIVMLPNEKETLIKVTFQVTLSSGQVILTHLTITSLEDRQCYYILQMISYGSQKMLTSSNLPD